MWELLIHERTEKSNQIKGTVAEGDFVFPVDLIQLRQAIVALVDSSDVRITLLLRRPSSMSLEQLMALQQWVDELDIERARKHP